MKDAAHAIARRGRTRAIIYLRGGRDRRIYFARCYCGREGSTHLFRSLLFAGREGSTHLFRSVCARMSRRLQLVGWQPPPLVAWQPSPLVRRDVPAPGQPFWWRPTAQDAGNLATPR